MKYVHTHLFYTLHEIHSNALSFLFLLQIITTCDLYMLNQLHTYFNPRGFQSSSSMDDTSNNQFISFPFLIHLFFEETLLHVLQTVIIVVFFVWGECCREFIGINTWSISPTTYVRLMVVEEWDCSYCAT